MEIADENKKNESEMADQKNQLGINGITNLGNTCYINASLNCLFKIQPLCDYFQGGINLLEINESNPLGSKGRISAAFGELLK